MGNTMQQEPAQSYWAQQPGPAFCSTFNHELIQSLVDFSGVLYSFHKGLDVILWGQTRVAVSESRSRAQAVLSFPRSLAVQSL